MLAVLKCSVLYFILIVKKQKPNAVTNFFFVFRRNDIRIIAKLKKTRLVPEMITGVLVLKMSASSTYLLNNFNNLFVNQTVYLV